ncbi:type II toxin-antitoxin system RelE/ParE family toxin [Affinirhizobium pseudoryzae]|uniref:type II toxin-antitoxin system RelE/ParE family toxin n=1 Tax=Allorhizobium pseudoryzae TaxID=379684 RepID=UPI0013EBB3DA|nr:type II toxin-antitoxin system RelE/ParE family toxin [Allorhizobium pseudoryzae]
MPQLKQSATFEKWLRKRGDERAKAIIAARLQRLVSGLMGDIAPIGDGISELRIHYGPGYRIYLKQQGDVYIILLCAGDKGFQQRDIETAKRIAADWRTQDDRTLQ